MSDLDIRIEAVAARPIAAARGQATPASLTTTIFELLDQVWPFLRRHKVPTGHNVVIYHDTVFNIEAGVEVFGPLPATEEPVLASQTPAGRAATTTHWGPYSELPQVAQAVLQWCAENGYRLAGTSWEVYGDWSDDPSRLRTDVFFLLEA